ncbi:RNA polymerase sigma factor [Acidicapsa dinghuensis]|uniref:RNA polymerase sigma factor n=1 Tax=Acidicapsa dinghuensis TaxID=2218256 RepID=A0ABW1EA61_9BACT|nr:sigma-70 family RNA polymerase sigma factor [Acidicapsa dinghuensis]
MASLATDYSSLSLNSNLAIQPSPMQHPNLSRDLALVTAAQSGSSAAFTELREIYSARIYRTILAITKIHEDAEDALQDTFLRAYLALNNFEGRANFYSWLTRIAINSALMLLRKRRGRPEISFATSADSQDALQVFEFPDAAPTPEQLCDQRQRHLRLMRAIRKLEPRLRAVIEIQMRHDCSVRDIAEMLEISEAAVKSRLYRARARLTAARVFSGISFSSTSKIPA